MAARPCHEMASIWRPLMHLPSPKRQPVSNPKEESSALPGPWRHCADWELTASQPPAHHQRAPENRGRGQGAGGGKPGRGAPAAWPQLPALHPPGKSVPTETSPGPREEIKGDSTE